MLFRMPVSKYVLKAKALNHLKELVLNVYYVLTSYKEIIKKWNISGGGGVIIKS